MKQIAFVPMKKFNTTPKVELKLAVAGATPPPPPGGDGSDKIFKKAMSPEMIARIEYYCRENNIAKKYNDFYNKNFKRKIV